MTTTARPLCKALYSVLALCFITVGYFASAYVVEAATLSLSPSTGVYSTNGTFSVRVQVNTNGKPINAAEGTLSFNPRELSVVSVTRTGSIFNLWVTEPTFSNSAGTINFSGGLPSGYTGSAGNIMTVTFRAAGAGTARVSFTNGSVLANDGRGTNVLTAMNGGTYTIQATSVAPEAEVIVEYVPPANTPGAPVITSSTHADPAAWYKTNQAELSWTLPAGVTEVRTLLDTNPTSIPTRVYENPIRTITLSDLPEGVSYFHLQFKNADGWGKVSHYRLAVDTQNPQSIAITQPEGVDLANPIQTLSVSVDDSGSKVERFMVKIDNNEAFEVIDETGSSTITLPALEPGYHAVIVEAFDQAGNSIVGTYSFTILSFDRPIFTEYPNQINEEVIPVIKGLTRPRAAVEVQLTRIGSEPVTYSLISDDSGEFIFIPEGTLTQGVYELTARAIDEYGAQSELSDTVRIAVQQPGFIKIGSFLVSVLSVIVPLLVLLFFTVVAGLYAVRYLIGFRRNVRVESKEALDILHREFTALQTTLQSHEAILRESRKTNKLTQAESEMITVMNNALLSSQGKVEKEITDISRLTEHK